MSNQIKPINPKVGAAFALAATVVVACSSAEQVGRPKSGGHSSSPTAVGGNPQPSPASADPAGDSQVSKAMVDSTKSGPIKASYLGKAQALGMDVCNGNLDVSVNLSALLGGSVELFQIPDSAVNCSVVGAIDLKGILGSFGQQTSSGSQAVADATAHVIKVTALGGNTFVPARPMLPALFAATAAQLKALDVKTLVTMTGKDLKPYKGTSEVKMLSYDEPYTVATSGQTFRHAVGFTILNTGFDGADKAANLLFDSMEFHISLDPLAILSLTFKGSLQSVLVAADSAKNASGTGDASPSFITSVLSAFPSVPVQMTMDLVDQTGLTDALISSAKDTGNGDTIGGKPVGTK